MTLPVQIVATPTDWWTVWAAWIQAVGSIAAIAAAISISTSEQRRLANIRHQDRIDQVSLIKGVANLAYHHIREVAAMIESEGQSLQFRRVDPSHSQNLAALLARIEVQNLRSPTGALAVVGLANDVAAAPSYADAAGDLQRKEGGAWPAMEDEVNEWTARALTARNEILAMTAEF